MSLHTLLEAARYIELQERSLMQAEEEPKPEVSVRLVTAVPIPPRTNGVVIRGTSPIPAQLAATAPSPAFIQEYTFEHSRQRTFSNNNLGTSVTVPSPPSANSNGSNSSNGSNGSNSSNGLPRAGTREVHNKLEKNRRAHLKECFELLKKQLPSTPDDKKTSNLSILGSAIRYIQVLKRKERDCEHELERLAREKIAAQQRLATLRRDAAVRSIGIPEDVHDHKEAEERINGQVLGIPISITSSGAVGPRLEGSPPRTLNLSTKLRTLPIQITPTTSQVVRTTYGARHNTLTLTTLAPANSVPTTQNGQIENGVTNSIGTLVHPAQIHLPISQVVGGSGLVVNASTLQLLSTPLRVLHAPLHTNGLTQDNRVPRENGIISPSPSTDSSTISTTNAGSVLMNGLTPIVVSQPGHLLHTHNLTHKMVETQMMKGAVTPLAVSAQYLSTTIVKPVVVVTTADST